MTTVYCGSKLVKLASFTYDVLTYKIAFGSGFTSAAIFSCFGHAGIQFIV